MEARELILKKTDMDIEKVVNPGSWIFSPSGRYAVSFYDVDIGYDLGVFKTRQNRTWNLGVIADFDDLSLRYYDGLKLGVRQNIYHTYFLDDDRIAVFYGKDKCLFHRAYEIDRINKTAKLYASKSYTSLIFPDLSHIPKNVGACTIQGTEFAVLVHLHHTSDQFTLLLFLKDPTSQHEDLNGKNAHLSIILNLQEFELDGITHSIGEIVPYTTGNKIFLRIVRSEKHTDKPIVFAVIELDEVDFSRGKTQNVTPIEINLDINFNKFSQVGSVLISKRTVNPKGTSIVFAELDTEKFVEIPLNQTYSSYSSEIDVGVENGNVVFITPTILGKILISRIKIPFNPRDKLHDLIIGKLRGLNY